MSYRLCDHRLHPCHACEEPILASADECPFCGASAAAGVRKQAKERWVQTVAWVLILAFLAPTLLWLLFWLR